ncbi:cell wall-binding repeat-containing protein [Halobacillus litoralis]|uniref:cell wall-binding repeat-containing protein n=1 Tax=Halobacillus litoralis TaxID=45668 RepID=UPI001CFE872C|nr:cell wall-binding repeat-containing protein [Halobacillus litoralis]
MVLLFIIAFISTTMSKVEAETTGTKVNGILKEDTIWTLENSPYKFEGNVQVASDATLTIEPGVVIEGDGESLQVWGILNALGNPDSKILVDNLHIEPGDNDYDENFEMNISYADIKGGSVYPATSGSTYGSINLTNSTLVNIPMIYLWYPTSDVHIERNIFNNTGGVSVGTSDDTTVYIKNNVFNDQINNYDPYFVKNWASYDSSKTIVKYNTFLSHEGITLTLPNGYDDGNMIARENYWNTLDTETIESSIYDKNDDLSSADYIEYQPILKGDHNDTPFYDFEAPQWGGEDEIKVVSFDENSVSFEWPKANDDNTVKKYLVYKNGQKLAGVQGNQTSVDVNDLKPYTTYIFKIKTKDSVGHISSQALTVRVKTKGLGRLSGENRYETAIEISKAGWEYTDTVVIARSDDFPDALSGAPLAYSLNSPILLTSSDRLNNGTKEEIMRLEAKKAVILGGKNAVSNDVYKSLVNMGLIVQRIAGSNRYETSKKIADQIGFENGAAVIANGSNFPDALSIASYASKNGYPILLTKENMVPPSTRSSLSEVKETIVVGGTGVIYRTVSDSLPSPSRYMGEDRYGTNLSIVNGLPSEGNTVFFSTGESFADALTGSVLAAKLDAEVLLVRPDEIMEETLQTFRSKEYDYVEILGGTGAVSDSVENEIKKNLR